MATTSRLLRIARDTESTATDCDLLCRYVEDRDETAFAEIVRRNGPHVLLACRSVLGEATAAEDAFQATFLVLVRKASRLTHLGSLAGWLHATAVRIAQTARRASVRTRRRESEHATSHPISSDEMTWREVREVLDTELAALPEKYRLPLVLCYLQELSYEEAARRAGCSVGALRGRLERGKERLRKRLARYGLPLAAPALVLGPPTAVSAALTEATLVAVRTVASGGRVPAVVASLAGPEARLRVVLLAPVAVLAAIGGVLAGVGHPAASPEAEPPRPSTREAAAEPVPRTDRFGDPLPAGALARLGTARHRAAGAHVAVTPDGKTVVTAGNDLVVRTFDAATGNTRETRTLDGPPTSHTALSADGRYLVGASYPAPEQVELRVWDLTTGKPAGRLALGKDPAAALAVHAGTTKVAFIRGPHTFPPTTQRTCVWDFATGAEPVEVCAFKPTREVYGEPRTLFSPDGSKLLAHQ